MSSMLTVLICSSQTSSLTPTTGCIWPSGAAAKGSTTRSILIGEPDLVLQKEAERERAAYLTPPLEQKAFLTAVASLLSSYNPARRSPRKRVWLDATVDGVLASLVDLSYEGLRLEVPNAEAITLPSFFTLHVPSHDVACRVQRVWTGRPSTARDILWCGAVLPGTGLDAAATASLAQLRRHRSRRKCHGDRFGLLIC